MIVSIDAGVVRVGNVKFCICEVSNGEALQPGSYDMEARFSPDHGKVLPYVAGIGWFGDDSSAAIVLGTARNRSDVLGDGSVVDRLVACVEATADLGRRIVLEVK